VVRKDVPWFYESGRPMDAFAVLCQHPSSGRSMIPPAPRVPLCDPVSCSIVNCSQTGRMRACYNKLPFLKISNKTPVTITGNLRLYILKYSCCYQQIAFINKFAYRIFIELFIFKWTLNIYIYRCWYVGVPCVLHDKDRRLLLFALNIPLISLTLIISWR
jgi:hypothetical protein